MAVHPYQDYRDARRRGWRGDADADNALGEVVDLVALLDVCADEFVWRKLRYWHTNWHRPLAAPGMVSTATAPRRPSTRSTGL